MKVGTSIAATPPISPSTPKKPGGPASRGKSWTQRPQRSKTCCRHPSFTSAAARHSTCCLRRRSCAITSIAVNALTYATNREPKGKEQSFDTPPDGELAAASGSRGVIEIAKLRHGGGCNDAPGALLNLLRTASQGDAKLQVRPAPELINIS